MAERRAQFSNRFAHVWSDQTPGLSFFQLVVDFDLGTAQDLVRTLFRKRVVADIEELRSDSTLKIIFNNDDRHMETHTEIYKYIGVTSDERIPELTDIVNTAARGHTRHGKFPAFDIVTSPIHTGNKDYLIWAQEETAKVQKDHVEE